MEPECGRMRDFNTNNHISTERGKPRAVPDVMGVVVG